MTSAVFGVQGDSPYHLVLTDEETEARRALFPELHSE